MATKKKAKRKTHRRAPVTEETRFMDLLKWARTRAKAHSSHLAVDGKPECVYGHAFHALGVDFGEGSYSDKLPDGPGRTVRCRTEVYAPYLPLTECDDVPIPGCSGQHQRFVAATAAKFYENATVGDIRRLLSRLKVRMRA